MAYRENAPVDPPCPRCGAPFFKGAVGHLDAFGCGQCGGLWLDNAATVAVLQRFDMDASKLARLVDARALTKEPISPFAGAAGACPMCNTPLTSTTRNDVALDYCAAHGTFFDRGELARVLAQAARVTAPAPAAPRGPSIEEIRSEVRHDLAYQKDPLTTSLLDWMTGGKDWVNRWRK